MKWFSFIAALSFIEKVSAGQKRMVKDHPGATESHHLNNLFPHLRFVTVNSALSTGWLVFLERTVGQSLLCIIRQLPALIA